MSDVEESPVVPKREHSREASLSSIESSPELDADGEIDNHVTPPASIQVQKRKGGRKPIYATSEERKQRNRQAQAAFRERRTEYIKQLETTIKQQDETLQNLQQNHRSAADECLMLRYKNSLLERILLEKGIDVQAELKRKEIAVPGKLPASIPQPTPVQRAVMNRRHVDRSGSGNSSSLLHKGAANILPQSSPQLQPTPHSQGSSPTASRSPQYGAQGGMNPPQPGFQAQPQPQQQHQLLPQLKGANYQGIPVPASSSSPQSLAPRANAIRGTSRPSVWPSPYQTHIEQLEQEYDAPVEMIDDADNADDATGGASVPYPQPIDHQQQSYHTGHQPRMVPQQGAMQVDGRSPQEAFPGHGQGFDPYDPMLDADPFGLTASMHFPTQFSYQDNSRK